MMELTTQAPPSLKARIAGAFYLLTIIVGVIGLYLAGPNPSIGHAANLIAAAFYVVVTVLLYFLFRPVSKAVSMAAAILSITGSVIGPLSQLHLAPDINSFIFYGAYCVLIGYLIYKSTFLPRLLGVLMTLAGLGYLTFLWPALETHLWFVVGPMGLVAEGSLTVWLLAAGVDDRRWRDRAHGAGANQTLAHANPA
jgi:hypothetical protein